MPGSSYSVTDIQDYIEHTIKNRKKLISNPPIYIYINVINNRLVFEINDACKIELKIPEIMKLFGSTKKLVDKKNGENLPSLEVIEAVLVRCNLVDNQYQAKSEILYTFMPNKSYGYLLNVEPNNLVF